MNAGRERVDITTGVLRRLVLNIVNELRYSGDPSIPDLSRWQPPRVHRLDNKPRIKTAAIKRLHLRRFLRFRDSRNFDSRRNYSIQSASKRNYLKRNVFKWRMTDESDNLVDMKYSKGRERKTSLRFGKNRIFYLVMR